MSDKRKILIVDDSEMNRALLEDMLCDDYEIIEAENGLVATKILQENDMSICLVLLDIVMPVMDGFETLEVMNKKGWIKNIPVVMISAETASTFIDRAYDLGAVDYISRPFDERTVRHRVDSNVILGEKQRDLSARLTAQIYEKEKDNRLMIEILSHIVEFRNGESGLHVLNVHTITEFFLKELAKKTDKYNLTPKMITLICNASALHDVGKIVIPSEILNKPGRFTPEEFAIMKTHTVEGAKMLQDIPFRGDEPLIKISYQICRWHHERYDGRGYPDGLKGEEIPIAAQVVALADVYDALTSKRVYKPPFTHEKAVEMILNGECGTFNPLLLECLKDSSDTLKQELHKLSLGNAVDKEIQDAVTRTLRIEGGEASNRTLKLLEQERTKFYILSGLSREIIFEYNVMPEMIKLSDYGAESLGMPISILNPAEHAFGKEVFEAKDYVAFREKLMSTTPLSPSIIEKYLLTIKGEKVWCKVYAQTLWSDSEPPEIEGAIGKIIDVNAETNEIKDLEEKANTDARTGLFTYNAAKRYITELLAAHPEKKYALLFFDIDRFKAANDTRGHTFGDDVIKFVADTIKRNTRSSDIAARWGGDEFLVFMEYRGSVEPQISRLFKKLQQNYDGFEITVSMGIACKGEEATDYDTLFERADKAAYFVKNNSKNAYRFYDDSMKDILVKR